MDSAKGKIGKRLAVAAWGADSCGFGLVCDSTCSVDEDSPLSGICEVWVLVAMG